MSFSYFIVFILGHKIQGYVISTDGCLPGKGWGGGGGTEISARRHCKGLKFVDKYRSAC